MEAEQVDPAPLEEEPAADIESPIDGFRVGSLPEKALERYKRLKDDEVLTDEDEKRLYSKIYKGLAAVIDNLLPTPLNLFVREKWIERGVRFLHRQALTYVVDLLDEKLE